MVKLKQIKDAFIAKTTLQSDVNRLIQHYTAYIYTNMNYVVLGYEHLTFTSNTCYYFMLIIIIAEVQIHLLE